MKIHDKLDELVAYVEAARGLPMSSSVVINKGDITRLLAELRELLPDDLLEAQAVLERREQIITEAVANAERLLTAAEEEKQRLVADEEVLRQARIEAGTVMQAARAESEHMAREIDGYVDAKLAHLEVSITKLLDTVRQGRDHLAEPGLYSDLAAPDVPEPAAQNALETSYEQPEYAHGPTGYEPYQPEVDLTNGEPDPLTDDVWLPAPAPTADGAREPEAPASDGGSLPDDVEVEAEVEVVEEAHDDAPSADRPAGDGASEAVDETSDPEQPVEAKSINQG